jgi:acyl-CoA synthetase
VSEAGRFELFGLPAELERRYLAEGAYDDRSLGQFLSDCLQVDPTRRIRIWSPTHPYTGTVGDVYHEARRVAGGLAALGLGPGDVVAFQLPNWMEAAATFYAAAMLGVILVPIVHFYGSKEVRFILRQSRARAFIVVGRIGQRDYLADLDQIKGELADLEHVIVVGDGARRGGERSFESLLSAEPIAGPLAVDPASPALIAYTSGTTADPKGVIHTHRTLGFEVRQLGDHQDERSIPNLTGAPVGHAIGMLAGLLVPLYRGQPLYLIDGWDPPTVLAAMIEEGIGAGNGSTYFFTSLLDSPGFGPEHLERMRTIGLGGSPIPDAVAERADKLGISLTRAYGCTEHPSVTGCRHADPAEKRIHTDGRPLPFIEVRTVDEDGDTPIGRPGEIVSRGPDRFAGYTDPTLSAAAIDRDGWFRTGDVGVIDAEGYLTVTDRVKDIIIRGGENVSAAEVEQLLAKMDGVAEVAVVAAPDERMGEHGCAYFRLQAGTGPPSLEHMRRHLEQAGLARQKWPEEIRVVEEFPRTASGKVQKFVLRDQLRAGG